MARDIVGTMNVTFHGAAQTVTGSQHLVCVQGRDYLLDCGQYQGRRKEAEARNRNLPFRASSIEAVMLSHAHIDHSGNLPMLVKSGFNGPVYSSPATADLCVPMLTDSAGIHEKDAAFLNKRRARRKAVGMQVGEEDVQPLYTVEDAERTFPLFRTVPLHTPADIGPGVVYETWDAGHILGSTCMALTLTENGRTVRLGFSGDVGRTGLPIINDPESLPPVDYLILESTYGDRLHRPIEAVAEKLADIVTRTYARGGRVIVPAFAVGRTQQLVLMLHELINAGRIPALPIFVDSPLAVNITEVYRKHSELFDSEARAFSDRGEDPFGFSRLRLHPRGGRIEGAERSACALYRSLGVGHVRSRPHSASPEERHRRPAQHHPDHRLSGREHAGPQAGGALAGSAHLWRNDDTPRGCAEDQ